VQVPNASRRYHPPMSTLPPADNPEVLIIGGGHNGLVCACYLAGAGLRVRILERRGVVGGAAVTEEFHPGFRNSTASYTVSLLSQQVIDDLRLHENGLQIVERPLSNFLPLPGGEHLRYAPKLADTQRELARHSKRDAERLPAYVQMLDAIVDLLRQVVERPPPNLDGRFASLLDALKVAGQLRRMTREQQSNLHEIFTRSAGEILDYWFETDAIKAVYGWDSVVGNYASPYTPGSGYVLLHHAFGGINGKPGQWGHAIGGMGAISQAIAREAERRGVEISTDAPVARVEVQSGRARGVTLEDGRFIPARMVCANVNPKLLFLHMLDEQHLDAEFRGRMQRWRCGSGSFRINVALSELPCFSCLPGDGDHLRSGILIGPSLRYMDYAYLDARLEGWSRKPIVELLIPSTVDDTLAPAGAHVASLFCQHVAPELPDGRDWNSHRNEVAELMIDTVDAYAPNFRRSVLGMRALSPLDLEQEFGLIGGDIFHGALGLDQLYSARPALGHADHRAPVSGLYMCGSGTHPGGGVTGIPGRNCARIMLHDRKRGGR
jgi:phytoene dehydrogenase-like protein